MRIAELTVPTALYKGRLKLDSLKGNESNLRNTTPTGIACAKRTFQVGFSASNKSNLRNLHLQEPHCTMHLGGEHAKRTSQVGFSASSESNQRNLHLQELHCTKDISSWILFEQRIQPEEPYAYGNDVADPCGSPDTGCTGGHQWPKPS